MRWIWAIAASTAIHGILLWKIMLAPMPVSHPSSLHLMFIHHSEVRRTKESRQLQRDSSDSPQNDGNTKEDQSVPATTPQLIISVIYPYLSRQKGEEGTVILEGEVGLDGKIRHITLIKSSTFTRLDRTATEAFQKAYVISASPSQGKRIQHMFTFRLTE